MRFRFQSFVDISTSAASMQVIQWSVGGPDVIKRCRHLFGAYKYFKLGKISIKMVPASTLPVDPLQLSYDGDDPQSVDPRDQMNPGLVRITNGEDIFTNVSLLDDAKQQLVYNNMMLDPRWSKFMLQSGFRRTAYPLYWQVGQLSQDAYPGATENIPPQLDAAGSAYPGLASRRVLEYGNNSGIQRKVNTATSSARGLFQVGHRGKLGFLPTDYYQQFVDSNGDFKDAVGINPPVEVSVITCVLPKAFKTLYYYRVFITEEVIFAGLRAAPLSDGNDLYFGSIDNFVIGQPTPILPGNNVGLPTTVNNYGNMGQDKP